jgi:hypothetical protein
MKTAVYENYKPTRYEGKGFLGNLNIRIHRDITGEMWFGVGVFSELFINQIKQFICQFRVEVF